MRPAALALIAVIAVACTPAGSSPDASLPTTGVPSVSAPSGSATPAASTGAPTATLAPGERVELAVGTSAAVEGTNVTFGLLEASGPEAGCNDCPNHVRLQVSCPPDHEELAFAFSGGMEQAALDRARRKSACGMEFYVVEVQEGSAVIRVDRAT